MAALEIDFVVYLGDPDDGAEAVDSRTVVENLAEMKDRVDGDSPYGALTAKVDKKDALPHRADPIVPLITGLLTAVPYVLDGEQENVLLSESEHGVALVGGAEGVVVSFFAGDAFEPDEYLLPETPMPLDAFGEQVVGMGQRLKTIVEAAAPEILEADQSFLEFFESASEAVKRYKLEVERGVRN